jgi:hypothetical protein
MASSSGEVQATWNEEDEYGHGNLENNISWLIIQGM